MLARLPPEERLAPSERLILLGIGGLIFGGFLIDVLLEFAWLKAGALFMFVAWVVLIVVHEAGHALMAAALGWRVCRIAIGMGNPVLRFRVAGVPVVLCRYPVGGHVVPAPVRLDGARYKSLLIYAAGPGAELLVLAVIVLSVGFERLVGSPSDFWVLGAQATALVAFWGVIFNLIPLVTLEGAATDGLGMLTSPWLPREAFEARVALPYTTNAETLVLSGRRQHAIEVLRAGAQALGNNLPATVRIAEVMLEAEDEAGVIELLDPVVQRTDVPEALRPGILACLSLALVRTKPDRLEDADAFSEHALGLAPRAAGVRLARARVLIELGRLHPAEALLAEMQPGFADERLADARDVLRARLELSRGRRESSLKLVRELEARGARGPELRQLLQELGPVVAQSQKHA